LVTQSPRCAMKSGMMRSWSVCRFDDDSEKKYLCFWPCLGINAYWLMSWDLLETLFYLLFGSAQFPSRWNCPSTLRRSRGQQCLFVCDDQSWRQLEFDCNNLHCRDPKYQYLMQSWMVDRFRKCNKSSPVPFGLQRRFLCRNTVHVLQSEEKSDCNSLKSMLFRMTRFDWFPESVDRKTDAFPYGCCGMEREKWTLAWRCIHNGIATTLQYIKWIL
jgi:hypothetical protein